MAVGSPIAEQEEVGARAALPDCTPTRPPAAEPDVDPKCAQLDHLTVLATRVLEWKPGGRKPAERVHLWATFDPPGQARPLDSDGIPMIRDGRHRFDLHYRLPPEDVPCVLHVYAPQWRSRDGSEIFHPFPKYFDRETGVYRSILKKIGERSNASDLELAAETGVQRTKVRAIRRLASASDHALMVVDKVAPTGCELDTVVVGGRRTCKRVYLVVSWVHDVFGLKFTGAVIEIPQRSDGKGMRRSCKRPLIEALKALLTGMPDLTQLRYVVTDGEHMIADCMAKAMRALKLKGVSRLRDPFHLGRLLQKALLALPNKAGYLQRKREGKGLAPWTPEQHFLKTNRKVPYYLNYQLAADAERQAKTLVIEVAYPVLGEAAAIMRAYWDLFELETVAAFDGEFAAWCLRVDRWHLRLEQALRENFPQKSEEELEKIAGEVKAHVDYLRRDDTVKAMRRWFGTRMWFKAKFGIDARPGTNFTESTNKAIKKIFRRNRRQSPAYLRECALAETGYRARRNRRVFRRARPVLSETARREVETKAHRYAEGMVERLVRGEYVKRRAPKRDENASNEDIATESNAEAIEIAPPAAAPKPVGQEAPRITLGERPPTIADVIGDAAMSNDQADSDCGGLTRSVPIPTLAGRLESAASA